MRTCALVGCAEKILSSFSSPSGFLSQPEIDLGKHEEDVEVVRPYLFSL